MGLTLLLPLILIPGASVLLAFGPTRTRGAFAWRAALAGFLLLAAGSLLLAQLSRFSPATAVRPWMRSEEGSVQTACGSRRTER